MIDTLWRLPAGVWVRVISVEPMDALVFGEATLLVRYAYITKRAPKGLCPDQRLAAGYEGMVGVSADTEPADTLEAGGWTPLGRLVSLAAH